MFHHTRWNQFFWHPANNLDGSPTDVFAGFLSLQQRPKHLTVFLLKYPSRGPRWSDIRDIPRGKWLPGVSSRTSPIARPFFGMLNRRIMSHPSELGARGKIFWQPTIFTNNLYPPGWPSFLSHVFLHGELILPTKIRRTKCPNKNITSRSRTKKIMLGPCRRRPPGNGCHPWFLGSWQGDSRVGCLFGSQRYPFAPGRSIAKRWKIRIFDTWKTMKKLPLVFFVLPSHFLWRRNLGGWRHGPRPHLAGWQDSTHRFLVSYPKAFPCEIWEGVGGGLCGTGWQFGVVRLGEFFFQNYEVEPFCSAFCLHVYACCWIFKEIFMEDMKNIIRDIHDILPLFFRPLMHSKSITPWIL